MTWQTELVVSGADSYREFQASMVSVMTSLNVSAIAVNAAGTGYIVGDVLTIAHASAYHTCKVEVLTIGGSGEVLTVRINTGGAYAERVTSAVVGAAAGSGYVVGDILKVDAGSGVSLEDAFYVVATLSGSAVATVTKKFTGGSYSTSPTTDEATTEGVSTGFAGDDAATLDLTLQTIMGATGIAGTGGTGSSATFDPTLTATGWKTLYDRFDHDWGTQTDNNDRDVVLEGTVSTGDTPIIGFASVMGESGALDRYALAMFGMTAFNSAVALTAQPNIGPLAWDKSTTEGAHLLITEEVAEANSWWISVTGRRVYGCVRGNVSGETDSYHTFYSGFMNQYGTATTSPYPMLVAGSSYNNNQDTFSSKHTGLAECYQEEGSRNGPVYFLRKTDLIWAEVVNGITSSVQKVRTMWPNGQLDENTDGPNQLITDENFRRLGNDGVISSSIRANLSNYHYPAPGANDEFVMLPLTVTDRGASGTDDLDTHIAGELDGCFWTGGTKADGTAFTSEDFIENAAGDRYRIFPCNSQSLTSRRYQFMLMREN